MSHITTVKCKVLDLVLAEKILKEKGFKTLKNEFPLGYAPRRSEEKLPLLFEAKGKMSAGHYRGGFNKAGEMVYDAFGYNRAENKILNEFPREYSKRKILRQLRIKGMTCKIEETDVSTLIKGTDYSSGQEVAISVFNNGESSIHVTKGNGKKCKDLTKEIEKAIGTVSSSELTADYYNEKITEAISIGGSPCG